MIDLNPEIVANIANIAREFQTMASMDTDTSPELVNGAPDLDQLSEWHGDTSYLELKNAIEDLEPDQQATLVALMWVGRGDYMIDDWDAALTYANEVSGVSTSDYLIATPLLADYLEEGLILHGYDEEY